MKKPWAEFATIKSNSFVPSLVSQAAPIPADDLVDVAEYKKQARTRACNGIDPIEVFVAYAQEEYVYDTEGRRFKAPSPAAYAATLREARVNIFSKAYRADAKLWLHKTLADILIAATIHLQQTQGWRTVVYDGLRTMEGGFNLYNSATDEDLESGLLATPGKSSHNKAMAVDSMMVDGDGREIDMGGHFDHLNMVTNSRNYVGGAISKIAKRNRLIREAAFLRGALTQGLLVAPLRAEFWHDQLPENHADLWRVLESAARVMGANLLSEADHTMLRADRKAFAEKWESWNYEIFKGYWHELFEGMEERLIETIGTHKLPETDQAEFYHGNYHPIYDAGLKESGKGQV